MPYRQTPLINNCYYHVLNRGNGGKIIFKDIDDYNRCLDVINYYRFQKPVLSYSIYNRLTKDIQEIHYKTLIQKTQLVEIICFCLMPNHCHLLLKQVIDRGISLFMSHWQNSYARYFNTKYYKKGYFFESSFKAKIIENESLLWHISRYIHLNPSTASLIPITRLTDYPWSSLPEYLDESKPLFTNRDLILSYFQGKKSYYQFVINQAAYQKELHLIKKMSLE